MRSDVVDLMIDTETGGLPPDGALMSIGAVFFNIETCTLGPTFSRTIHLGSSVQAGGTIDPGTVIWWLRQGDDARKAVAYGGEPIELVLTDFQKFIDDHCGRQSVRPWGNSSSFDLTIVSSAYKRLGMPAPWAFWNERCFRTVRAMYPQIEYDVREKGTSAHNALSDAKFQAEHLFKIKRALQARGAQLPVDAGKQT